MKELINDLQFCDHVMLNRIKTKENGVSKMKMSLDSQNIWDTLKDGYTEVVGTTSKIALSNVNRSP